MIEDGTTFKEKFISYSLAGTSGMALFFVIYLTVKEILKKTNDSFVLKDQYTIYFVTLVIISLLFKMMIIDTALASTNRFNSERTTRQATAA